MGRWVNKRSLGSGLAGEVGKVGVDGGIAGEGFAKALSALVKLLVYALQVDLVEAIGLETSVGFGGKVEPQTNGFVVDHAPGGGEFLGVGIETRKQFSEPIEGGL